MELYRRLPGGWQPTPPGIYTDLHFWQRLLSLSGTQAASGTRPTVLHFPSDLRLGWSIEERIAEIHRWNEPDLGTSLRQKLLDNVLPDRAALDEALTSRENEVADLSAHVETLKAALAEAESAHDELQRIAASLTWRLRGRLLSVPVVRSAARALARRAAPAAAERPDRDPRPRP
jgi:hypothetical protein